MPETEYRTLARLGGDPGKPGEKGDRGPAGPAGDRGLPGQNAIPADEATGAYASAPDSATYQAIDSTWAQKGEITPIVSGVVKGFARAAAIGYGHSYIAGTGLTPSQYWASRLAASMGVGYTNRGIGGALAEDVAWRMWSNTANGFTVGSKATLIFQAMLNSLRLNGVDTPTWRGVNYALRTMVALASAKSFYNAANARFTYSSSGWSAYTSGVTEYPGSVYRATSGTTGAGAYVEFTTDTPPNGTQFLTLARKVGLAPALTEFRRMDTNEVILLWENKDNAAAGIAQNYAPTAFSFNVPRGTTIRVTNLANGEGGGTSVVCGLLERDPDAPNTVIMMKEPKLANWAASTMFPNGSDEAVDYFNTIIDNIAAANPNVIAVAPEPWWTKQGAARLVMSDEVHPTDEGHQRLRQAALAAVAGQALRGSAALAAAQQDTGWRDLSSYLSSGFTGTVQGRRVGDLITITGLVNGSLPSGASTQIVSGLPTTFRPITNGATTGAVLGSTSTPGAVQVLTSGVISVVQSSGATLTTVRFSATFLAPVS